MSRRAPFLLALLAAGSAAADPLYDAAAAAERQAAARAVLAAEAGPAGPYASATGLRCTAQTVTAIPPRAEGVVCTAQSATLARNGDAPVLPALLRWVQGEARAVAAPATPAP